MSSERRTWLQVTATKWSCSARRNLTLIVVFTLLLLGGSRLSLSGDSKRQANHTVADNVPPILAVRVMLENKPVAGAQVAAVFLDEVHTARTDRDGLARLTLPPGGKINGLAVLHPELGIGGHWFGFPTNPSTTNRPFPISLVAARPHRLRVIDSDGKPVPNARCVVEHVWWPKSPSISLRGLEATHFQTDSRGETRLAWVPRDVRGLRARIVDEQWKTDDCNTANDFSTVHVRRLEAVNGRLHMPNGVAAEGRTISANGSGVSLLPHNPTARVRRDGSFTIYLAAGDAYTLELTDPDWASDAWTGIIPGRSAPAVIDLTGYPATPLSIRVTHGPKHEPVMNAWINSRSMHQIVWKDARGQSMVIDLGVQTGLYTDEKGLARISVGKGPRSVFMAKDKWRENRTLTVTSSQPVLVDFDRPWTDKRTVTVRLMHGHKPHVPSPATIVRAWGMARGSIPSLQGVVAGTVGADGWFTVELDATDVGLYAVDPQTRLAAFGQMVGPQDAAMDLQLVPTGSYSGTVVDETGKPLAGHGVQLIYSGADLQTRDVVIRSADCDQRGRFKLDFVPAQVPLTIFAGTPATACGPDFSVRSDHFQVDSELEFLLDPGEARENVHLVSSLPSADSSRLGKPSREPVEAHLERRIRDVRLAHMRLLVILRGDASKEVTEFTQILRNSDEPREILRYILLSLQADEIETALGLLSRRGWERPGAGEAVLIAVDGLGATLGMRRIAVANHAATKQPAIEQAAQFIKQYAPPRTDAKQQLATAQNAARQTGRRLLFVEGGPRCEPCRLLAGWIEEQHALLSKDYVVLKVLDNDEHAGEVIKKFHPEGNSGIPWFAIAEADGTVLATSDGPLGNMGMPSRFEDKRRFKKILDMTARRLTAAERQKLLDSLHD